MVVCVGMCDNDSVFIRIPLCELEKRIMDDLIEALTILRKYGNPSHPTCCEHDILHVGIDPSLVSVEDLARLEELSFRADSSLDDFQSFRFGSA